MKKYPKVPRHDLDFVSEELFSSTDMVLLEKLDGMNFRFTLYEDRFHNEYSDQILEHDPSDGDIVFGTKSVVRGCVDDSIDSFYPEIQPGIKAIRAVDREVISEYQTDLGPIIWFAENMVPHTLDYEYEINPPPELIGFDVYVPRLDNRTEDDYDSNPYKERFVGYLRVGEAREMFKTIGIEPAPIVATIEDFGGQFDPEVFTIPQSRYAPVEAEGVVIRSDSLELRSKYVRESFKEMHKSAMGANADRNEEPEQWILDSLVTPSRIRKTIRKCVKNEGYSFSVNDDFIDLVSERVLSDAWIEEFSEIRKIDDNINPGDLHKPTHEKVFAVADRMKQMSARTGQKPEDAWLMFDNDNNEYTPTSGMSYDQERLIEIERSVAQSQDVEDVLIDELIGDEFESIVNSAAGGQDLGGSLVTPATDRIEDRFWTRNESKNLLWRLHINFNPSQIRMSIMNRVKNYIEDETGDDLDKGGDSWEPDGMNLGGFDAF